MQVRTYRAKSLKEALRMVQHELGPETKIVQTREVDSGWWDRFARGRQFEIRAREPGSGSFPLRRRGREDRESVAVMARDDRPKLIGNSDPEVQVAPASPTPATDRLDEKSNATLSQDHSSAQTQLWFEALASLIDAEVPESSAREFLEDARRVDQGKAANVEQVAAALVERLAGGLRTCGPIRSTASQRRIVALVGPTGVGKTTTIAKLAANLRLREQRRVGLITVDTYRVAAVEQLRTFAEIMDLSMEVVATPQEMRTALSRLADQDVVLIDTSGQGPRDAVRLQQLRSMLAEAQPDETHLVISAVSATPHLYQIMQSFSPLGANAVLVTKLDEATGLGNLLPVLRTCRLPVSYLTCGQTVPDDIVVAQQKSLINVVLGNQPIAALI